MRILITGGAGYIGTVLTSKLLLKGHEVDVLDTFWFGDHLPDSHRLRRIKGDVREIKKFDPFSYDVVYHFASVANDPCTSLDPSLSWSISCESSFQLADSIQRNGSNTRIVYASSGSVYGVKEEESVVEDLELIPISTYNRAKIAAERILLSYSNQISIQIVRPATVCGLSPRMRLDVAVNLLTMQALRNGEITVLGGDQYRPNIHIIDLVHFYEWLLENPAKTGIFNAGFENITINELAQMISVRTNATIIHKPSNDPRSYRVDSSKILKMGFKPTRSVGDAIDEIIAAYRNGTLKDNEESYNVNWMRSLMSEGIINE
jgi:nucleoside-diphosphate-sugar epimerase